MLLEPSPSRLSYTKGRRVAPVGMAIIIILGDQAPCHTSACTSALACSVGLSRPEQGASKSAALAMARGPTCADELFLAAGLEVCDGGVLRDANAGVVLAVSMGGLLISGRLLVIVALVIARGAAA